MAISLLLESPRKSKTKKGAKKLKKQLISMPDDSNDSQSLLPQGTEVLEEGLAGGSDKEGDGDEGEEATQASKPKRKRARITPRPTATYTVTSGSTLTEHTDEGEEEEGPSLHPRKAAFPTHSLLIKNRSSWTSLPLTHCSTIRCSMISRTSKKRTTC